MRKLSGYTLIEILVVMVVISIVTGVALLSVTHNQTRQIELFANDLTQMLTLAEEQAMLQSSAIKLTFNGQRFEFASQQSTQDGKNATWAPMEDALLGQRDIPDNLQVEVKVLEKTATKAQIIISTNGDMTPFVIYVGKKGDRPRYAVTGEADGNVTKKQLP